MKKKLFFIFYVQAVSNSNLTNDDASSLRSMSVDETPGIVFNLGLLICISTISYFIDGPSSNSIFHRL